GRRRPRAEDDRPREGPRAPAAGEREAEERGGVRLMAAEPGQEPRAPREQIASLEARVEKGEERRRALVHLMGDLNEPNRSLADQRKAMLHILKDSHRSNQRLGDSRKA